jgi:hypothetical protein
MSFHEQEVHMAESWHSYQPGQRLRVADVVAACRRHIAGPVELKEEKSEDIDELERCGHETIVYQPQSEKGWGSSPLNLNNWETEHGIKLGPPRTKPR